MMGDGDIFGLATMAVPKQPHKDHPRFTAVTLQAWIGPASPGSVAARR